MISALMTLKKVRIVNGGCLETTWKTISSQIHDILILKATPIVCGTVA